MQYNQTYQNWELLLMCDGSTDKSTAIAKEMANGDSRIKLIGDGPTRKAIENIIEKNNVSDNVILLGSQNNPHKYTSKCDIMVCSSYSEGYSTVCAEAIMLGIPVISTNVSGSEEIISDSGAGIVVGMDDNDLYMGLKTILSDSKILTNWRIRVAKNKYKFSQEYRSNKLFKTLEI